MKRDIRDVLFWIFMAITIILLLWSIFGDSPTELLSIMAVMFTILFKIGSVDKRLVRLETKFDFFDRDFKRHISDFKELTYEFKEHTKHIK